MKICIICPTPNLERFATQSDAHLLLTHLIAEGNEYTTFYKNRPHHELKILDNGLFEHHVASPTPEILQKAELVGAHVVIAPDVLYDARATVESAKEFKSKVQHENGRRAGRQQRPLQIMAVPQADNPRDYLWCYKQLVDLGFEWVGLSILACPKSFSLVTGSTEIKPNRIAAYKALKEAGLWAPEVKHHLLGLGSFVDELEFFAPISNVVSNDSSSAVVHGQRDIRYVAGEVPGGKIQEKLNFDKATPKKFHQVVLDNIEDWKYYASFDARPKPKTFISTKKVDTNDNQS